MNDRFDPDYDPYRQERALSGRRPGVVDIYQPAQTGFGEEEGGPAEDGFDFWGFRKPFRNISGRKNTGAKSSSNTR